MLSMTAFCRKQAELEQGSLVWEIRSVNHRYLETAFRLPEAFRGLEMTIRKTLRSRMKRGKVDCTLRFRESDAASGELRLNPQVLTNLARASEKLHDHYGDSRLPSSLDILRWPGVIEEEPREDSALEQAALALFNGALDEFLASRAREGEEVEAVIRERVVSIREILAGIRGVLPALLDAQRRNLLDSIAELKIDLDARRIEQEVALLVQKADIAEELDRLDAHVNELERLLGAAEPAGRQLDFLMQELMREANTICSKSAAIETTRNALDLKALIEQIREQVQNLE